MPARATSPSNERCQPRAVDLTDRLAGRVRHASRPARDYLRERFRPGEHGGPVLSAYLCCYLLFGAALGRHIFGALAVVGGATFVLLFLLRRLTDDIEDLSDDLAARGLTLAGGEGRRRLRGLVCGWAAVAALILLVNAPASLTLLVAAGAVAAWFPLATVIKRAGARSRLFRFVVNETCPAAILAYGYAAWLQAGGDPPGALVVSAICALFWTVYQFWNFTRKVGAEGWPPWELTLPGARRSLIALLSLSATCSAVIALRSDMPAAYLAYGVLMPVTFAAWILRWWSVLPARAAELPHGLRAPWAGVPFAVAVELGVLLGVLGAVIGE
jgi:hypothetical protein